MAQVKVCSFAPGQNLEPLMAMLRQNNIEYSLKQDTQGNHLFVDDADLETTSQLLNRVARPTVSSAPGAAFFNAVKQWPLCFSFVVLGIAGYVIARFDPRLSVVHWLTFTEITVYGSYITYSDFIQTYLQDWQWWRLITPTFLHFGEMHILFNALALWEVGRRLEYCLQPRWFLFAFFIIALGSNLAQYWVFGSSLFGGLSGVLYGFIGALPVLFYRTKLPVLAMPKGLYVFLAITLFLGPLGVMEKLFGINVADGAHFGGLLCGLGLAAIMPISALKAPVQIEVVTSASDPRGKL